MRSSLACVAAMSVVVLIGFVGPSNAHARAAANTPAQPTAKAEVVQALQSAHALLAKANHDYQGHRVRALRQVARAIRILAGAQTNAPATHFHHALHRSGQEAQAASDAQLRRAQEILQGLSSQVARRPRVAAHVKAAIAQINTALSIR